MNHYDKQILEARQEEERRRHTTLATGIYVDDELITFERITLPGTRVRMLLPEYFIPMQETVKNVKYPSRNAPDFIVTSLDTMVNFGFNVLPVQLEEGDTKAMSIQFQEALRNINPSIRISERVDNTVTETGSEMCGTSGRTSWTSASGLWRKHGADYKRDIWLITDK